MATRAQITVNGSPGSNDNVPLNLSVQLDNDGLGDEVSYLWTIISQPTGSPNAVLSSATSHAPTFTPNKEGSYLIELVVNQGLPDQKTDRVIVAVLELETLNRIPAAGETTENNAATGWANTAVDQILQRVTRFTDQGVLVGKVAQAGLEPLDVVYVTDVGTIATGLPGEREVPVFEKASAATQPTVRGLLGVLLGGVDGSSAPAVGSLIRVAVLTLVKSVQLGTTGLPDGTPVYVSDAGTITLTPGTIIRQIGTTIDDMGGGNYGVWITGTGTFGTIQGLTATAPVTVVAGVSPVVGLAYDAGNLRVNAGALDMKPTAVTAGTYGAAAPAYPAYPASLVPSFTVDAFGRLTAASQAGLTIGGSEAQTYVDNGDAATLAAAEAFAQSLAYGVSSKVPVHVATTTALPANTANGSFQTLTANSHGPLGPIDGHTLLVGERILVKNETATANNGIYVLTQAGASAPSQPWIMTRADDANTAAELCGSLVTVNVGTVNAGTAWLFAYNPTSFVLGTTPVVWTQLNAVPATTTVYGTVKLAGGLGGTGTLAATPVLALFNSTYLDGQLPASNGGTGLSGSGGADRFLVGTGVGGWVAANTYTAGSVLDFPAATIRNPIGLLGNTMTTKSGLPASLIPVKSAISGGNLNAGFVAGIRRNTSDPVTDTPTNLYLLGEDGNNYAGSAYLIGGTAINSVGASSNVYGGSGKTAGGAATVMGGNATTTGNGGDVLVQGGKGAPTSGTFGGGVTIQGGDNLNVGVASGGGDVTIQAGIGQTSPEPGYFKKYTGRVFIYAAREDASSGAVVIGRHPDATGSETRYGPHVEIDSAFINGSGTAGQVFTSNGSDDFPTWQDLGGAPGPAASGAFRTVASAQSLTLNDFAIYAKGSGPYTLTLPVAATVPEGRMFIIKPLISNVSLEPAPGDSIDISVTSAFVMTFKQPYRVMRTNALAATEWIFI